jgi:HEAT repeat protein/MFS family permease
VIGFVVALNARMLQRLDRRRYISFSLAFFMVLLVLFWFLFRLHWGGLPLFFWLFSDIFIATTVTQFWIAINDICNPRQAKRLIGFFVSGGLLGGIFGSLLVSRLAKSVGTKNLLLIPAAVLLVTVAAVNLVYSQRQKEKLKEPREADDGKKLKTGYLESLEVIRKNRYLSILAGVILAGIVVSTLIDMQFNSIAKTTFPDVDARTSFLGTYFGLLLIFSYVLNVLTTSRVLRKFGIRVALLITPVVLLIGAGAVFLVPAGALIYWGIAVKGSDKTLDHTLSQAVRELLYIPVSPELKYKAKIFIDMFVNKAASGIGSLLFLLFVSVLKFTPAQVSFVTISVIGIWLILILSVNREYVGIFKKSLKIKWQEADKFVMDHVDMDLTKRVFDTIQSKEKSSVLYAMNLFDLIQKEKLTPELKKIISYKSDEIRAKSMDSLFELSGESFAPEIDEVLKDESLDAQVKEIMSLDVYQQVIQDHIHKVVGEENRDEVSMMEAAKVMGMIEPTLPVIQDLSRLIVDDSPDVASYAIESAAKLQRMEFVPLIIRQLGNPYTQQVAVLALIDYGEKILGTLRDYLRNPEEDLRVRRAIPDIVAQIGSQRAADILTSELAQGRSDVESEIIEALYKMKSKNPQLSFPQKPILAEIFAKINKCYLTVKEIDKILIDQKRAVLAKDLENSLSRSLKHVFELLGLIYSYEDMRKAYQNICTGTKKSIDYSIELLENILEREMRELLLPLIDDIPFEEKARQCNKLLKMLEKVSAELS